MGPRPHRTPVQRVLASTFLPQTMNSLEPWGESTLEGSIVPVTSLGTQEKDSRGT